MTVLALGAIVVLALLVGLTWAMLRARADRRWAAAEQAARWADAHEAVGGVTRVLVRRSARLPSGEVRVLGESVIDEVPTAIPTGTAGSTAPGRPPSTARSTSTAAPTWADGPPGGRLP